MTRFSCPACRHPATGVISTYSLSDGLSVRRRRCLECDHRWYTAQEPEYLLRSSDVIWARRADGTASAVAGVRDADHNRDTR
jgi:transcriptional regulator NrdR family protein